MSVQKTRSPAEVVPVGMKLAKKNGKAQRERERETRKQKQQKNTEKATKEATTRTHKETKKTRKQQEKKETNTTETENNQQTNHKKHQNSKTPKIQESDPKDLQKKVHISHEQAHEKRKLATAAASLMKPSSEAWSQRPRGVRSVVLGPETKHHHLRASRRSPSLTDTEGEML